MPTPQRSKPVIPSISPLFKADGTSITTLFLLRSYQGCIWVGLLEGSCLNQKDWEVRQRQSSSDSFAPQTQFLNPHLLTVFWQAAAPPISEGFGSPELSSKESIPVKSETAGQKQKSTSNGDGNQTEVVPHSQKSINLLTNEEVVIHNLIFITISENKKLEMSQHKVTALNNQSPRHLTG